MLVMLDSEYLLAASFMMFPLMLSRESTSLTLVCFLLALWKRLRWTDKAVAVVSAIAGSVVVSHLAARAQPNSEQLPGLVYMLAKVPWNFLNNVLGLAPWSNVNTQFCAVPSWSLPLHFGPVHAIGVCGFSVTGWVFVSEAALSVFGLLPLLLGYLWWRSRKTHETNVLLRFALVYGAASIVLAPVLGTWFTRLISYAWPIFFVALPMLFDRFPQVVKKPTQQIAALGFFAVHLVVFYWAYQLRWVPQLGLNLLLWGVGFVLLRVWFADAEPLSAAAPLTHTRPHAVRLKTRVRKLLWLLRILRLSLPVPNNFCNRFRCFAASVCCCCCCVSLLGSTGVAVFPVNRPKIRLPSDCESSPMWEQVPAAPRPPGTPPRMCRSDTNRRQQGRSSDQYAAPQHRSVQGPTASYLSTAECESPGS